MAPPRPETKTTQVTRCTGPVRSQRSPTPPGGVGESPCRGLTSSGTTVFSRRCGSLISLNVPSSEGRLVTPTTLGPSTLFDRFASSNAPGPVRSGVGPTTTEAGIKGGRLEPPTPAVVACLHVPPEVPECEVCTGRLCQGRRNREPTDTALVHRITPDRHRRRRRSGGRRGRGTGSKTPRTRFEGH